MRNARFRSTPRRTSASVRDALIEAVAETSEEYMERYFSGEEFTQEEIVQALREHVSRGQHRSGYDGFRHQCTGLRIFAAGDR